MMLSAATTAEHIDRIVSGSSDPSPTPSAAGTVIESTPSEVSTSSELDNSSISPSELAGYPGELYLKLEARNKEEQEKCEAYWKQNTLPPPVGVTAWEWEKRCMAADKRERKRLDKEARGDQKGKDELMEGWLAELDEAEANHAMLEKQLAELKKAEAEQEAVDNLLKELRDMMGNSAQSKELKERYKGMKVKRQEGKAKSSKSKGTGAQARLSAENLKIKDAQDDVLKAHSW